MSGCQVMSVTMDFYFYFFFRSWGRDEKPLCPLGQQILMSSNFKIYLFLRVQWFSGNSSPRKTNLLGSHQQGRFLWDEAVSLDDTAEKFGSRRGSSGAIWQ